MFYAYKLDTFENSLLSFGGFCLVMADATRQLASLLPPYHAVLQLRRPPHCGAFARAQMMPA